MDLKIHDLNPILSKITRLVAAIKSLRFALFSFNSASKAVNWIHVPMTICISNVFQKYENYEIHYDIVNDENEI